MEPPDQELRLLKLLNFEFCAEYVDRWMTHKFGVWFMKKKSVKTDHVLQNNQQPSLTVRVTRLIVAK